MRRAVGQRLGLLCGESEAVPNGPGGGEVEEEGEDLPTASLRSGRLRRRAYGACGSLSRRRRRGKRVERPPRPCGQTSPAQPSPAGEGVLAPELCRDGL